jgi:hypothetical protein
VPCDFVGAFLNKIEKNIPFESAFEKTQLKNVYLKIHIILKVELQLYQILECKAKILSFYFTIV